MALKRTIGKLPALFAGVLAMVSLPGCEGLFEYSPYQVRTAVTGTARNGKTLELLAQQSSETFKPFKIALISDSHTFYDDFEDQVAALNRMDSIDFVIHLGDITLSGIYREFVWYAEIIDKLRKPILTVIGNHDCLSNGEIMYREMFGPSNLTVVYNNCKLVLFDDIIWERNVTDPNFQWLYDQLGESRAYTHQLVFAHIHPWDAQFSVGNKLLYNQLMEMHGVSMSVHGHAHKYQYSEYFGKIPYLLVGDSEDREIVVLEIKETEITVNRKKI
ncbi:MAG: metallophosphoesterase [Breznakibacter sp.]